MENPNNDDKRRHDIINDIKCRIQRVCIANDQDWYIGEDRITYRTIAIILNGQFYNGKNPITGSPFDGKFVIDIMKDFADFFERTSPPTVMDTPDDFIKTFAPDSMPYIYSTSTRLAESLWQKYEDDCLDWLLKKDNSHVYIAWGDSVDSKLDVVARMLRRISVDRQWPNPRDYSVSLDDTGPQQASQGGNFQCGPNQG
ncbi:hypothetical protein IFR05_002880 [Cadophora sp. M221]|nr:hypothetical protein IFR05_002880 [Cadophora sp. M221]